MIGAKLKIALLYDLWNEDPVAAAAKEEAEAARKPRKKVKKVKKRPTARKSSRLCKSWATSLLISSLTDGRSPCTRFRVATPTSFSISPNLSMATTPRK